MSYVEQIEELAKTIKKFIDMDLYATRKRVRPPTQAFSDFLTNREQGDWAEELMLKILNKNLNDFIAVSYGRKDRIIAGDKEFKEFFEKYQDELDSIGKCPDILIFKKDDISKEELRDMQSKPRKDIIDITKKAIAGLEVRSSAFLVKKYAEFIKGRTDAKKRNFLSFTPKIEDLSTIFKWIKVHEVPHFYVQVLFDSIYVISFEKILTLLSDKKNLKTKYFIEKNSKNQFKSTIHINLNEGFCISQDVQLPEHKSEVKELSRGRLLFYVKFATKELPKHIDEKSILQALNL
ncbi:MAG: hypothetical protein A2047_00925 [Omnitrophica bacterium GWA2_41_15]|nr:MAG: hypothetical protein A2047_00925 [Omnitrophica bacterium GWA2_41_15]